MTAPLASPLRGLLGSALRSPLFGGVGGGVGPVAPFQSIAADGFTAQATAPAAAVGQSFTVTRNGYDASANAITFSDTLSVTSRMRTVWNVGWTSAGTVPVNDAANVALSDYVYQGESVSGVTNSSAVVSPKPIAAWVSIERQLIGNTVTLEVVAGHRDARGAKPVACVTGTMTDGTNTVTAIASTPTLSTYPGDIAGQPLWVYALTFNTTSLISDVLLTANAKVYPHVGVAASVLDSSASSDRRAFSPQYFIKNVSRLATPPVAYIDVGAAGGTWSTNPATALADPFPTVEAARVAIPAQSGQTGGYADGCEIRLMAGTHAAAMGATATAISNKVASMVITRDPAGSRATCILNMTANVRPRFSTGSLMPVATGAVILNDITLTCSAGTWQGEAAAFLEMRFDRIDIAFTVGTAWLNNSVDYFYGTTITTTVTAGGFFSQDTGPLHHRMWRATTCLNMRVSNISMFLGFGNNMYDVRNIQTRAAGTVQSGAMRVNNRWMGITFSTSGIEALCSSAAESSTGIYIAQNVYEPLSVGTGSYTGISVSADNPQAANTTHVVLHNNTCLGAGNAMRFNGFYDETATVFRQAVLHSFKGNIVGQLNTKGDWFYAVNLGNVGGEAPSHIGNWGFLYGVGCAGNWAMYVDASGTGVGSSFTQAYMGAGSVMGSSGVAKNNPLITTYGAVDYVAGVQTAGVGGSVFTLQAGSPCKSRLPSAVLPFDMAGTPRSATLADSTGAFL